jgi:uncharacterized protein YecE (DUF72 family)
LEAIDGILGEANEEDTGEDAGGEGNAGESEESPGEGEGGGGMGNCTADKGDEGSAAASTEDACRDRNRHHFPRRTPQKREQIHASSVDGRPTQYCINLRYNSPMNFYLGCAVWSFKGWVGDLFPAKTRAKDFLSLYSRRMTAVEANTTFYAVPDRATVARWAAETPAGFQFCPKMPKDVTHGYLLEPKIAAAIAFIDRIAELGERLGPIFVQLPPRYSPQSFDDLQVFLEGLPRDRVSMALEVRHLDWFEKPYAEQLNELLHSLGMGRVLLDTRPIYNAPDDPQIASERRKPKVPLEPVLTAKFAFVRFISHPEREYNQVYVQEWAQRVASWLSQGTSVYFFVHCPVEARSPQTVRWFQQELEAQDATVPPLPWNQCQDSSLPSQQLNLLD